MGYSRPKLVYWKFGVVVRRRRLALGMSLQKLADISGHNIVFIGHIEHGTHNASMTLAEDLARALGTTLGAMIVEAEKVRGRKP
jgi:transcriptional regulator with XRE-family HTH domain